MEDLNQFPALSSLRPQRKFLGVQVPAMDQNFHGWAGSTTRDALIALEVLGEQKTENGDYVFVFYEDNVVRRVSPNLSSLPSFSEFFFPRRIAHARQAPARRFVSKHRAVWDYYRKSFFFQHVVSRLGCLSLTAPFQSTENSKEHCSRLTTLVVLPTYIPIRE